MANKQLVKLRHEYLEIRGKAGGTAKGFRDFAADRCRTDPSLFPFDAILAEAATRAWEAQPRSEGPDLFSVSGKPLPGLLTRPRVGFVDGDDEFEKVNVAFATVHDLREDALIKMRNGARTVAAAEERMKQADEALKRANGDYSVMLSSIRD